MLILQLAWASLGNRRLISGLTIFSIALSIGLLLSVERLRRGAEEGFTQTISQTDLIVGPRGGPLNLLLYSVFNMGSPTNNLSYPTYQKWKSNPAVEWTIPISLGDGHRGFRIVGTDENFYEHYRFRGDQKIEMAEGHPASGLWDAVLGAEAARTLQYRLGQKIVIAHGVTSGPALLSHDDKPFTVVGILKPTGTALDRSIYITLQGDEALHIDWKDGAAPRPDQITPQDSIRREDIKIEDLTAFFLRTKSRIETLRLQREINDFKDEPLTAVIPAVALGELWQGLGDLEKTLGAISWMVLGVGLLAMLIALLTLLEQRRREMSILRAVGASPRHILALLLLEALSLTTLGVLVGAALELAGFRILENWLSVQFGIYFAGPAVSGQDLLFMALAILAGTAVGVLPALRAFFFTLKDGLSVHD